MIRLNNEIKNQLCHNLLLASPLFEKAKAAVNERAKIVEEIRQALLKQENTSDEQITKAREAFKDIRSRALTLLLPVSAFTAFRQTAPAIMPGLASPSSGPT